MKKDTRRFFVFLILVVFCILGSVVFTVSEKITKEMSVSAINNLEENLNLIQGTVEAMLNREAEFQKLIAEELSVLEDPEGFILSYERNKTIAKMSLVWSGETEGISNTGEVFSEKGLVFSADSVAAGLPVSASYLNDMGSWAYTMKCPVLKDGRETGMLYVEYIYESFDNILPERFYNNNATLYLMDATSERFVLKPKRVGERIAGDLDLADFYRANNIMEEAIQNEVSVCIRDGRNLMFYHDILKKESLIYMWAVNGGTVYLVGYAPIEAIQREGSAVNQNIMIVVAVMLAAFFFCCLLYFLGEKQREKIRKERESERELHNVRLAEALQAAKAANNSKTMFLSNMSHDIRTPMNAILGFTTLLARDADNPVKVREYTKKITSSGKHLLGLINDVLDVSKIESGKMVLSIGDFSLKDMVSSIDAIIRPMAKEKKQSFDISVTGIRYEELVGDETRLNQVLLNLLSNAVKYTQEGGKLWLRIIGLEQHSSQYEHIRIEVEDNGYGMTPEYQEILFDAFTRAENSTTNKVQGTGLGMAITKSIVELMGGTIEVTSKVGRGSLFGVDLELRIQEGRHKKPDSTQEMEEDTEHVLQGLHFLVAEDNEINAEILKELLEMESATCEITENGSLALKRFEHAKVNEFDAVLMDVQMPVMNGFEATKAIRMLEREDAKRILIVAMTANAFAEDVKDALNAGMDAHVAKPIDMDILKKTIHHHLHGEK